MTATIASTHYARTGIHQGAMALCAKPECAPWPVRIDASTEPCQCWHPLGAVIHGGHCCMKLPVICHAVPAEYREPEHCPACGYPDRDGTQACGLCAAPLRELPASFAAVARGAGLAGWQS